MARCTRSKSEFERVSVDWERLFKEERFKNVSVRMNSRRCIRWSYRK